MNSDTMPMMPTVTNLNDANAAYENGARSIICKKHRKTADNCPDRHMQLTCHTEAQIQNFYQGPYIG